MISCFPGIQTEVDSLFSALGRTAMSAIVCYYLFTLFLSSPVLTMHTHLKGMKNEGDNAVDINSLSENVLLVSRGHFQKMAPNLSCSSSSLMWGEFFPMTLWERSSMLCLCWISLFKEQPPGKLFPSQQTLCFTCPYFYLRLSQMYQLRQYAATVFVSASFFPKTPFCNSLHFSIQKIAESQEYGRIKSQLADWIVFCSISGCIKRLRLWTYKKLMDASPLRLDRSELTSAEGKKGKKKDCDLLTRPVEAERRINATQLPQLTATDVKKCSHCFSVCLSASLFFSMMFRRNMQHGEITEDNYHSLEIIRFCD